MRIAFVSIETVHHRETETNQRFQTVIELLRDAGHDVHLFCSRFWSADRGTIVLEGITYHAVAAEPSQRTSFGVHLPVVIRALGPDIVHVCAEPPGQVLAAKCGAVLSRCPLVAEWYGEDGILDDPWTRQVATRPDQIITPSQLVRTWVRERGAPTNQTSVVANPIDLERIQGVRPQQSADIVYARRLDAGANLESLLLALAELRERNWRAVVVGDGSHREMYENLAQDLRIDDRVSFTGDLPLEERIAIYRGAHVFAQTAENCVFPTELLWGLAAGCVGVVEYHTNSSAHELVEGRRRGFRTTDQQELADTIVDASRLEQKTIDDNFREYDREQITAQYVSTYRRLIETV